MTVSLRQALERARGAADAVIGSQLARLRQDMEFRGASNAEIEHELEHWRSVLEASRDGQLADLRSFMLRDGQSLQ